MTHSKFFMIGTRSKAGCRLSKYMLGCWLDMLKDKLLCIAVGINIHWELGLMGSMNCRHSWLLLNTICMEMCNRSTIELNSYFLKFYSYQQYSW